MSIEIRLLGPEDRRVLDRVAPDVFDGPVESRWAEAFLADPRHHLVVALDEGIVVGMASALDYVHPDKAPQLWINEIGVAPTHRRRGIGLRMLRAMLAHGRALGCTEAWLGTELDNVAARGLYERAGGTSESLLLYEFPLASEFTVRPLVPDLLSALADTFAPAPYDKPRAQYDRYLEEHLAGTRVTLVAIAEDDANGHTVIGYVNLLWHSDYPRFAEASVPEINDLNVLAEWRRRGVGTALIAAAEAVARDAERAIVGIGVGLTADYDAARRLYPALGYVPDGHGPRSTAYGEVEYLTKDLGGAAVARVPRAR